MIRRVALFSAGLLVVIAAAILAFPPRGAGELAPAARGALRITDRHGRLLRELPTGGLRTRWVSLADLPPCVPAALVAAEDRRFRTHGGVDVAALLRSAVDNLRAGRIVSGGSTITQQLARLLAPRSRRTLGAKLGETLDAFRLELRFGKDEILEQYLNRVAFGRNAVGVDAAARAWFGHGAATLTPAEAAWLAVLPRAPAVYARPEESERLERRRRAVLDRLHARGVIDRDAFEAAVQPLAPTGAGERPFEAPHLTEWLVRSLPPAVVGVAGTLRTTLDQPLQAEIERLVAAETGRLAEQGGRQAAVVVIDNRTSDLLALVGSSDFFSTGTAGQVNGALALRQPGSTLKPFTYALAFERAAHPATVVADVPALFPAAGGPFSPRNYGGATNGPVRLREALGSSLNIAAVALLERVGEERLYARLVALGLLPPGRDATAYGLGLTLGVAEVRLLDLTNAYGALAREGRYRPPRPWLELRDPEGRLRARPPVAAEARVLDPLSSWWVGEILRDDSARIRSFGAGGVLAFPWPVAVKTGTSSDWRDNWAVGYSHEYSVGVWVGDFTGRPMERVSGVTGAAPLLRGVFDRLAARESLTAPPPPPRLAPVQLCALSGGVPVAGCPEQIREWFPAERVPRTPCTFHGTEVDSGVALPAEFAAWAEHEGWRARGRPAGGDDRVRLLRPLPGETYFLDPALPSGTQSIRFEAAAAGRVEWRLDGRALGVTEGVHRVLWPLRKGRHTVSIRAGKVLFESDFHVKVDD